MTDDTTPRPRRGRGRPPVETPYSFTTRTKLTAVAYHRLDAELTRQIAADPRQRPLPNRGSIIRDALDSFLVAVGRDPSLRVLPPADPLPFVVQVRLTEAQREQLDDEVVRQLTAHPGQRPLPSRADVFRTALDLYLNHQEAKHGQPALPFPSSTTGGSSDAKS